MSRRITQRELRDESGRIMRALDKGKAFLVTRNGVPVGALIPLRQRAFVPSAAVLAAFAGASRLCRARFRKDVGRRHRPGCHASWLSRILRVG